MLLRLTIISGLIFGAISGAAAQQPDPDLAGPMIRALQAQVELQQAIMRKNEEASDRKLLALMRGVAEKAPALNALRWATNPIITEKEADPKARQLPQSTPQP